MNPILSQLLLKHSDLLSDKVREKILSFYEIVVKGNEAQNLTRLVSPEDFYSGHVLDVLELVKTGWIKGRCMDLGSGVGVPGILAALMVPSEWVLAESEKRKAEYLKETVDTLNLGDRVIVFPGRAEEFLKTNQVDSIAVRAVGSVERIYSWVRDCSTWNNLILFKGPGWETEWERFRQTKFRNSLQIVAVHDYEIQSHRAPQSDAMIRELINLKHVPRGTV